MLSCAVGRSTHIAHTHAHEPPKTHPELLGEREEGGGGGERGAALDGVLDVDEEVDGRAEHRQLRQALVAVCVGKEGGGGCQGGIKRRDNVCVCEVVLVGGESWALAAVGLSFWPQMVR
jgi:hypothetical protein